MHLSRFTEFQGGTGQDIEIVIVQIDYNKLEAIVIHLLLSETIGEIERA